MDNMKEITSAALRVSMLFPGQEREARISYLPSCAVSSVLWGGLEYMKGCVRWHAGTTPPYAPTALESWSQSLSDTDRWMSSVVVHREEVQNSLSAHTLVHSFIHLFTWHSLRVCDMLETWSIGYEECKKNQCGSDRHGLGYSFHGLHALTLGKFSGLSESVPRSIKWGYPPW